MSRPRIIHFVTGGGSGATKVALEIASGHLRSGNYEPLLILRRKRAPLPAPMQQQINTTGLRAVWIEDGFKGKILRQLAAIIEKFKPQLFVAHGNSEHLWGRQAAFAANVPVVVHIEQNNERYLIWRKWAAQRLAPHTSATVCVSHGVAAHARALGITSPRVEVIHNAVDVSRLAEGATPLAVRNPDIVMAARFARQKDQPTLIRAAQRLVTSGWTGRLLLAGGGRASHQASCRKLAQRLGIADRVDFLGQVSDTRALYHGCRAAVLSTHYEGLPLALVEYMAAGCAAIGSAVSGVTDIISPGENGWLFPEGDDAALARILTTVLAGGPVVEDVIARAQAEAPARFSLEKQLARYEALFAELMAATHR